jgi:2-polyprenyl-3-methyl-5-hydroxy-6-metoxy-1,4-benzoquinol methylase
LSLFKTRYEDVNKMVLSMVPMTSSEILDLGCGIGCLGAEIKKQRICTVTGITNSKEEAEDASRYLDKVVLADLNVLDLSFLGKFDCIVCSHILEHLYNPWGLLEKLRDSLTVDGIIVVALPNAMNWRQRVQFLRGEFNYVHVGLMDRGHIRFFSRRAAIKMIEDAGYRIINEEREGHFPLPIVRNVLRKFSQKVDQIATNLFPGLFGLQFIFLAKKVK